MGEGTSEIAAACAAGVFSVEDAQRLVSTPVREHEMAMAAGNTCGSTVAEEEQSVTYSVSRLRFISSLTGELAHRELTSPAYWRRVREGGGANETTSTRPR